MVSFWRPSRLTRAQQEERRLAAQSALTDASRTTRDLAQQFGVAEVTIRAWRARLHRDGEEALRASRATGQPERLTATQQDEIGAMIDGDPRSHGFDTSGWTIPKIRHMIGVTYGVWLDRAHLPGNSGAGDSRISGPHCGPSNATKTTSPPGFVFRARRWEKKVAEGATLVFLDESGFSLKTTKVRTWGRWGRRPSFRRSSAGNICP